MREWSLPAGGTAAEAPAAAARLLDLQPAPPTGLPLPGCTAPAGRAHCPAVGYQVMSRWRVHQLDNHCMAVSHLLQASLRQALAQVHSSAGVPQRKLGQMGGVQPVQRVPLTVSGRYLPHLPTQPAGSCAERRQSPEPQCAAVQESGAHASSAAARWARVLHSAPLACWHASASVYWLIACSNCSSTSCQSPAVPDLDQAGR